MRRRKTGIRYKLFKIMKLSDKIDYPKNEMSPFMGFFENEMSPFMGFFENEMSPFMG